MMLSWTMTGSVAGIGARRPLHTIDDPLLIRAVRFWEHLENSMPPSRRAIDPLLLGSDLLPHVFLADIVPTEAKYIFRLAGTAIEERFGPLRGRSLHDLHLGSISEDIRRQYDQAVMEHAPVYCIHDFITQDHRTRRYKRVVMPLATHSTKVDGLFGALVFAAFH